MRPQLIRTATRRSSYRRQAPAGDILGGIGRGQGSPPGTRSGRASARPSPAARGHRLKLRAHGVALRSCAASQGERVESRPTGSERSTCLLPTPITQVTINPLTAERIEVLRGPSALLFGSSAIGGVLNVTDILIPRVSPPTLCEFDALAEFRSGRRRALGQPSPSMSRSATISSPMPMALIRNMTTSTSAVSCFRRRSRGGARQPRSGRPGARRPQGQAPQHRGRIPTSPGGLAYVEARLNIGFSVSHHAFKYGVPIRFSLDPVRRPSSRCSTAARRAATSGQHSASAASSRSSNFAAGISKYHHDELDARGRDRLELLHQGRRDARRCRPDRAQRLGRDKRCPVPRHNVH